jgi:hypothetical protein
MDYLGLVLGVIVIWIWVHPETAGHWFEKFEAARTTTESPTHE